MASRLLILFFILCVASKSWAESTFQARVRIKPCPEYFSIGAELILSYSVEGASESYPAVVVAQHEYDAAAGTIAMDIELPNYFGSKKLDISAICRNSLGDSNASNRLSVSNCNHLALLDSDNDGLKNNEEDLNCDNFFSPGDYSNPENIDTDGDGVWDINEFYFGTDPSNPGSSPRPYILSGGAFDPDGDIVDGGNSNPVAWRSSSGIFFIRDFVQQGNHLAIKFGEEGDIPFVYNPKPAVQDGRIFSNIGVIRQIDNKFLWFFNSPGLTVTKNGITSQLTSLEFGIFGDNIILGPWETPGITNPAVARLFQNQWMFYIYKNDGTVRTVSWGGNGDIPKVQDYDGDGLFDIAVFRPSELKTYIVNSSDGLASIIHFGSPTSDLTVKGDYSGDGLGDISYWEPISGMFRTLKSDGGYLESKIPDADYYQELQLGLYYIHLPLNWTYVNGKLHYSVVDHQRGYRFYRLNNDPQNPVTAVQWGLNGDSLG